MGDLAALAQVYRDPRFETFRVVYMGRNSNVGCEVGYMSPRSATSFPAGVLRPIAMPEQADQYAGMSDGFGGL